MTEPSVFKDLGPAQLHYLKAQYLASVQLLDQTETALRAQLEQLTKARAQLESAMKQLDQHIDAPAKPSAQASATRSRKPAARASRTSASSA
jgi:cell division protein FtsB